MASKIIIDPLSDDYRKKIKEARIQKSMTQKDLAKEANVTQQTISALENGKLDPSLKLLLIIAGTLGIIFIIDALSKKGGEC